MSEIDDIIEEIRTGRRLMSEECGHDIHRLAARLRESEARYAAQFEALDNLKIQEVSSSDKSQEAPKG